MGVNVLFLLYKLRKRGHQKALTSNMVTTDIFILYKYNTI